MGFSTTLKLFIFSTTSILWRYRSSILQEVGYRLSVGFSLKSTKMRFKI